MVLALLEVVGIASIIPFMDLLSRPDAINKSRWLSMVYDIYPFESSRNFLIFSGCFIIGVIALSNILGIITTYFHLKISWNIAHRLSTKLLAIYANKPYSYYLDQNTSELRAYLIAEVAALTSGVLIPMIEFISRSIICTIIFALLIYLSPQITLTMVAFLGGAYFLIYISRQKFLTGLGQDRVKANADRFSFLEEMLTGIKTVKIYGVQHFFYERFAQVSRKFNDIQPKVQMVYATPKYLLEILAFGGILSVTMYLYISSGDITRALPKLSLYAIAGYRLLPSLQRAFSAAAKVKHNLPSLDKLYHDLVSHHELKHSMKPTLTKLPFNRRISIENLSFRYENSPVNILDNLNVDIDKGSRIAFVGSTGSGKTTLIDLVTGLLTPTSGHIKVDDVVILPDNVAEWQLNIGYVPQEVFLYDDTIKANIAIGHSAAEVDEQLLESVLKMADIYNFITRELPDGVDTKIGERGVRLSGGERQRLGLARALYTNPSLLVLDEATSALDSITEKGIMESLHLLPDDLTIIIIAHRLSTVKNADNIYLLENGKITDHGLYHELTQSNKIFKKMDELN